ncbi:MAG: YhjD/YihY/BrkB family envelope integrity protein [Gaiellaceae bacterium]
MIAHDRLCRLSAGRRNLPADPSISQTPPEDAEETSTPGFALGNRLRRIQAWLVGRADTALGRLALDWFRRYFESSRNSGCAITVYSSLAVLPVALVIASLVRSGSDTNVYAEHLITHMKLTGATAELVQSTFGTASSNRLAASITAAVSALLWGIGIGQIYRDVYARAWRLKVDSIAADQGLYAIFFFVLAGSVALYVLAAESLSTHGLLLVVPAWLVASTVFWLWVPRFLLRKKVTLRALMPGALMATVVVGGLIAVSPLFLGAALNANGRAFGSFGVVLTLIGYFFIMITLSLVCAVFSPVWADWRAERKARTDGTG